MGLHPVREAHDAQQKRVLDLEHEVDKFPMALHDIRKLGTVMIKLGQPIDKIKIMVECELKRSKLCAADLRNFIKAKQALDDAEDQLQLLKQKLREVERQFEADCALRREQAFNEPALLMCATRKWRCLTTNVTKRFVF